MEQILHILHRHIPAKFWLSKGGSYIFSDLSQLFSEDLSLIAKLGLAIEIDTSDGPHLKFYKDV